MGRVRDGQGVWPVKGVWWGKVYRFKWSAGACSSRSKARIKVADLGPGSGAYITNKGSLLNSSRLLTI